MKLIVCLDDRNGILFNGRRQSRDRAVCQDILTFSGNAEVWMRQETKKLFSEDFERIRCFDELPINIPEDTYLFLELEPPDWILALADTLIVYRWNRVYPADVRFSIGLPDSQWKLADAYDFPGYSHRRLTREVYVR